MRAVRLHGVRDLRVETIPSPADPAEGEVRLKVTAAGICGSDLHNYATGAWISRVPSVAGHELTGIVTACGPGVTHVVPGQRVLVDSRVTCGSCAECRDGLGQVCARLGFVGEVNDGGFAEETLLPARNLLPAPAGVADRHLAMAEPLAVALHALDRLNAPAGAPIVVTGCGPIGGFAALLAAGRGHPLTLVDRNADRAARVAEVTGGRIAALAAGAEAEPGLGETPPRHAIDATGVPEVIAALVEELGPGGAVALVGIGGRTLPFDPTRLVEREIALIGCHAFGTELAEVGRLLPGLGAALDRLMDAEIGLDAVPEAYERHLRGEVAGLKTIIRP